MRDTFSQLQPTSQTQQTQLPSPAEIDSLWLLTRLRSLNLLANSCEWWWENVGSFEVVVGAILTQNTKWEKVALSLTQLKNARILVESSEQSLENLAHIDSIESYITPSGLYRQKSARIIALARAIIEEFGGYANFRENVSREWLLQQKGIGYESADSILCYACFRAVMVVDSYSVRLLRGFGIEIDEYDALQAWFMNIPQKSLLQLYGITQQDSTTLAHIYARYHGKIVEFSKRKLSASDLVTATQQARTTLT